MFYSFDTATYRNIYIIGKADKRDVERTLHEGDINYQDSFGNFWSFVGFGTACLLVPTIMLIFGFGDSTVWDINYGGASAFRDFRQLSAVFGVLAAICGLPIGLLAFDEAASYYGPMCKSRRLMRSRDLSSDRTRVVRYSRSILRPLDDEDQTSIYMLFDALSDDENTIFELLSYKWNESLSPQIKQLFDEYLELTADADVVLEDSAGLEPDARKEVQARIKTLAAQYAPRIVAILREYEDEQDRQKAEADQTKREAEEIKALERAFVTEDAARINKIMADDFLKRTEGIAPNSSSPM